MLLAHHRAPQMEVTDYQLHRDTKGTEGMDGATVANPYPEGYSLLVVAIRQTEVFATWFNKLPDRRARTDPRSHSSTHAGQPGRRGPGGRRRLGDADSLWTWLPSLVVRAAWPSSDRLEARHPESLGVGPRVVGDPHAQDDNPAVGCGRASEHRRRHGRLPGSSPRRRRCLRDFSRTWRHRPSPGNDGDRTEDRTRTRKPLQALSAEGNPEGSRSTQR